LFTLPGVANTYTFLMNTCNTLPESYQQRVCNNILATVKCQIQQTENPTPAVVIMVEAAPVNNAIVLVASAKCNSVQQPYANLSDTPVALASASKYFQMLPAPPGALQNALRLCKSIRRCS
jgi:hypothetical protein